MFSRYALTFIVLVVFGNGALFSQGTASNAGRASDDPFESKPDASSAEQLAKAKAIELLARRDLETKPFSLVLSKDNEEFEVNVGEVFQGRRCRLEVTIENKSGFSFSGNAIRSSCGCLSGIPSELEVKQGESLLVPIILNPLAKRNEFENVVEISDTEKKRTILIRVRGLAKPDFSYSAEEFVMEKLGRAEFTVALVANDANWNWRGKSFGFTLHPSVYVYQTSIKEDNSLCIDFRVAVRDDDLDITDEDLLQFICFVRDNDGSFVDQRTISVNFGWKASLTPRQIRLQKSKGRKSCRARDEFAGRK
jgi:hypothetical protein